MSNAVNIRNKKVLENVIKENYSRLFGFAYQLSGNYTISEDIVQDTILIIYNKIDCFKEQSSFITWASTILKNTFLNFVKKQKSVERVKDEYVEMNHLVSNNGYSIDHEYNEKQRNLSEIISKLTKNDQEIIFLIEFEGYSYQEVAEKINISETAVKSRIFKARRRLAKLVLKNRNIFK